MSKDTDSTGNIFFYLYKIRKTGYNSALAMFYYLKWDRPQYPAPFC